ncbi:MAG: HYR domain-containing protein, partial [Saprospiraceae bacterium]
IAPIIAQIPANLTVQCDQIPSPGNAVATDNCGGTLTQTVTDVSTQGADSSICSAYNFVIERKYTISDACGNSANQTQIITVVDQQAPLISGLTDTFNIICSGSNPLPQPIIIDCDPNPELLYSETSTQDPDPENCNHYTYNVIRNWIYTDVCGNSSSFDQMVQVTDNLAPIFNLPANITVDCETLNAAGFNGNLTIVAECDPNPELSYVDHKVLGICPGNYFLERIWTLTDACDNASSHNQLISVRDTSAPKIVKAPESPVLECVEASTIQQMYADWLASYGNSIAEEPCGPVLRFKALPGTYDPQNSNTFPGQAPGNLVTDNCPSLVPGVLTSKTVDFVYYDSCLNVTIRQATFTVIDTTAPEVVLCVSNIELANDPGLCSRDVILTPPQINDACLSSFATDTLFAMTPLVSNLPGNSDTIVNPATLSFAVSLPALGSFVQPTMLSIALIKADAEHPEEYMNVYGEDDVLLGQTNQANAQCGNSITQFALDADKLVAWAADGQILIHLRPNIPGALAPRFGINDICGGTLIKGEIQYQFRIAQGIRATVQIDSGAITVVDFNQPININFPVGLHTVNYWISDCSGNTASCVQNWNIEDREKPEVDCPSDISLSLGGTTCDTLLTLPFPTNYTDNCGYPAFYFATEPTNADDALLHFIQDPNLGDYLPDNKTITFTGVPNDIDGVVHLQFEIQGDIDSLGEYFTILGEGGSNLGTTEIGQSQVIKAGNCNLPSIIQFNIPPALFKSWAVDGIVSFQVIPKTDFAIPPGGPGSGINPCDTVLTGAEGYDLRSYVYAKLSFNRLQVDFYTTGATIIPLTALGENGAAPVYSFNAGITEVVYLTKDQSGNVDSCQFVINLNDPIPPVAICKSATIFVNPSGVEPYVLDPSEVDGGSFDNCAIIKFEVTPNQFECNQFGQEIQVSLQVTDGGGNTSTCSTLVKIATETLMPSYTIGICEADTFQLFANAPYPSSGGNPYSFVWVGPNNFSSTLENPIIPNVTPLYSGSYTLTITGFGGCTATGSVDVVINTAVNTPGILVDEAHVCVGSAIHLTTTNYSGAVTYTWYSGVHPNGTQIAVTQSPELYTNLSAGNYFFYVIASQANCISNPSISINVIVIAKPLAMVVSNHIMVCQGEAVTLNSSNSGPGITYLWSGPAGFTAAVANPLVSNAILPFQAGIYVLFVSEFGCQSNPVQVQVEVNPKPAKPILATSGLACEDQAFIFSVNNISAAEKYFWIHPDGTTTITSSNTLSIPNLTLNDAGTWAVYVEVNGCRSDESIPFSVVVNPKPLLVPFNNGPVCVGDSIQIGTNIISGASYAWDGPNNFHSTEAQYQIIAVSGQYTVTITTQVGCKYDGSTQVEVLPIPSITAISNSAGDCATGSKDFQLIANVFPIEPGYMYFWTGPNGYLSNAETAIVANGNAGDNGIYKLYVKNAAGCKSLVDSTEIKVKDAPAKPSIGGDPTLCIGDSLILQTQDYGPGTVYYWFTPTGVDSTINNATYTLQNANVGNSGAYGVAVVRDGCQSDTSSTVIVFVYPIPSKPIVSSDPTICEGDTLFLNTGSAPNAVFEWQGPNLYTSDLQNPYIFPVMLQNAGFYTVRIISNECGSELSDPYQIIINARPAAPSIQAVSVAICADDPSANLVLCIDPASAISGGVYTWYQASSNTLVGGPALGLCNTIDSLNLLPDGINEFVAITELSGCASLSSIPVQVLIHNAPDVDAYAGTDDVSCGSSSYVLTADPIPGVDGKWTALQSQTQIQDLNNPITEVSNLQIGENRFLWSISYKGCPVFSKDTVSVQYEPQPTANDDIVNISFGGDLLIPILNNDIYSGLAQIEILRFPTRGNLSLQNESLFYESISNFAGEDTAVYRICSVFCPNMCDTA